MSADLCDAVYIDDRFGTERWVYREELFDREEAGELSVIFPDEPERLQSTVRVLFNVCKRSKLDQSSSVDCSSNG
jgi:3',5'-cyclic-nucleotide phosphodiesterase